MYLAESQVFRIHFPNVVTQPKYPNVEIKRESDIEQTTTSLCYKLDRPRDYSLFI